VLGVSLAALGALGGCRQQYLGVADLAGDGRDASGSDSGAGGAAGADAGSDAANDAAGGADASDGGDAPAESGMPGDGASEPVGPDGSSSDGADAARDARDAPIEAGPDLASDTPVDAAPETSSAPDDAHAADRPADATSDGGADGGDGGGGSTGACGDGLPAPLIDYAFEDCNDASNRLRDTAAPGADPALRDVGTRCVPARVGTGLFFDGTDAAHVISHVESRANVHFKRVTVAISVRPWRSPSAPIVGRWAPNSFLFSFDATSGHYSFKVGCPGNTPEGDWYETQAAADDDTWVDLVGVFDGNTVRLYKDGVLADEAGVTLPPRDLQDTGVPLTFGYLAQDPEPSPAPPSYRGDLDEVRVWGTALTAADVARLHCR
jgi:hypothetical protein